MAEDCCSTVHSMFSAVAFAARSASSKRSYEQTHLSRPESAPRYLRTNAEHFRGPEFRPFMSMSGADFSQNVTCSHKALPAQSSPLTVLEYLLRQLTRGPKLRLTRRERLLGLRVEGGVVNERVDKHPQVVLHVEVLDARGLDVLLLAVLDPVHHVVHDLVGDVVHVGPALGCANAIHEADL